MHHIIVIILTLRTKVYNMAENYNAKEFIFCVSVHTGRMNTSLPTRILCVCISRFPAVVAEYLHGDHGYLTTSCMLCMRLSICPSCVAEYSHWLHGYLMHTLCASFKLIFAFCRFFRWEHGFLTPSCFLILVPDCSGSSNINSPKNIHFNDEDCHKKTYLK